MFVFSTLHYYIPFGRSRLCMYTCYLHRLDFLTYRLKVVSFLVQGENDPHV